MTYEAPLREMRFILEDLCHLEELTKLPGLEEMTPDVVNAILDEGGKFASQVLAPLSSVGDQAGIQLEDGVITTPDGWSDAYDKMVEMGWNGPVSDPEHGGMGLPLAVNACLLEMFNGANTAFQMCTLLTQGAVEALDGYASESMKETYLPNLVAGTWSATMNLTEPQAGSDLAAIRTKAVPNGDHYLVSGQKIYISYGEHELTDNIVHLVLARTPDAPPGVKGISLFVVPKYLVNEDGSLGARNDLRCVAIEHKLGLHASPTCSMSFGDNANCIGYLVGEENQGLKYMFAMMNNARLSCGLQAIGIAETVRRKSVAFAQERKQGPTPDGTPGIIGHPDVRRMLSLIKVRNDAARVLAYRAGAMLDVVNRSEDEVARARAQRRVDLMIPIIKGWSTEVANENAALGVQIHGGMGFVEETGIAQHLRDLKISTIYEGTTGIQAMDLVGRKIMRDQGAAMAEMVADIRASAEAADNALGHIDWTSLRQMLNEAADILEEATAWVLDRGREAPVETLASATALLGMAGVCVGAWASVDAAIAAAHRLNTGQEDALMTSKLHAAAFYRDHVFPQARAGLTTTTQGALSVLEMSADDLASGF